MTSMPFGIAVGYSPPERPLEERSGVLHCSNFLNRADALMVTCIERPARSIGDLKAIVRTVGLLLIRSLQRGGASMPPRTKVNPVGLDYVGQH
jgi:hypothetical protein